MSKFKKLIVVTICLIILVVPFNYVTVSATESDYIYQFPMNKPEVTDNSGYVELLMYDGSNYIPSTLYFSFTTSSELGVTDISEINFVVNVSGNVVSVYSNTSIDGFLYLYLLRENGNCFVYRKVAPIGTNDITLHLNQVVGYHCYGAEFNSDITNVTNFTFVYGKDSVNYSSFNDILDYLYRLLDNSNISKDKLDSILNSATSIDKKCDDVIRYLYDISSKLDISNSRLDVIISILEQNKNEVIENQNQNTDKVLNGDVDLDSSGETDKVDGTIGGIDGATSNAMGGKTDEQVQEEISSALDTDSIGLDFNKASRISNFFDRTLEAFGVSYKTLLLLSLCLGLSAFLIGRRYG